MVRGERIPFRLVGPYAVRRTETVRPVIGVEKGEGGNPRKILGEEEWAGEWAWVDFKGLPWRIEVKVGFVDGVPQIVGLLIDAQSGVADLSGDRPRLEFETGPKDTDPTITADLLRQLPLRQLRESAIAHDDPESSVLRPFQLERPRAGWGDDHFRDVADVYANAPRAPLVAIGDRWGVSRAAASKWVKRARELGYLGYPSRPGVSGASAKKSPMKAKAKKPRRPK